MSNQQRSGGRHRAPESTAERAAAMVSTVVSAASSAVTSRREPASGTRDGHDDPTKPESV